MGRLCHCCRGSLSRRCSRASSPPTLLVRLVALLVLALPACLAAAPPPPHGAARRRRSGPRHSAAGGGRRGTGQCCGWGAPGCCSEGGTPVCAAGAREEEHRAAAAARVRRERENEKDAVWGPRAGPTQPGWSGSVSQIMTDESNPHLRGIFYSRAKPTLPSSNQTATGTGSLRPGSPRSPTKHTVAEA